MDTMEALWEYYGELAEQYGSTVDKEGNKKQAPYSLSWFYKENSPGSLNIVTRAFLRDSELRGKERQVLAGNAESPIIDRMRERVQECIPEEADPAIILALAKAIVNPLALIQTPAGTGRMEIIEDLLLCLQKILPGLKIAVLASKNRTLKEIETQIRGNELLRDQYAAIGDDSEKTIRLGTIHALKKCVKQGERFRSRFSCVILADSSQVEIMTGLLAMASAEHLVLLGDDVTQSVQICRDGIRVEEELSERVENVGWYYPDREENSLFHACRMRFSELAELIPWKCMCHPALVDFCNRYGYGGRLSSRREDDGKFPVRIRWYEGDYCENPVSDESGNREDYNKKQNRIFQAEEYPVILERMAADPDYSACVLSHSRKQLELLRDDLRESLLRVGVQGEEMGLRKADRQESGLWQLILHGESGDCYDYVCAMPVVDVCPKNGFPMGEKLILTAALKAKEEFCCIMSACWTKADSCLCGLFEYAKEQGQRRSVQDGFGLQKTSLISIFDQVPCYREVHCREGETYPCVSAPERCVFSALAEDVRFGDYTVRREVPLADVEGICCSDPETREYIQNGAKFDIVLCRNDRIDLIIEVDGAYHREPAGSPDAMAENDRKKDLAVRSLGEDFYKYRYLRLPTDGTTTGELQLFADMLQKADQYNVKTPALKGEQAAPDWILTDFKSSLRHICAAFREEMDRDYTACLQKLADMNFAGGNLPDYQDKIAVYYYLLRYAMAYTFEYAQMYQIALSFLGDTDQVKVYAFGCGSQNDCVSLCYAREKLAFRRQKSVRLAYTGVDLVRWPVRFSMIPACQMEFYRSGMQEFVGGQEMSDCDILCFPKILSENLDMPRENSIIDQFCENLKCRKLDRKRLVLCVSYRGRKPAEEDMPLTVRIIDALKENGYEMADVGPLSGQPVPETLKENLEEFRIDGLKCYGFREDDNLCIDDVDPNFEIPDEVRSCTDRLAKENEDKLRYAIKRVENMCFQVLLFKKE